MRTDSYKLLLYEEGAFCEKHRDLVFSNDDLESRG